LEVLVLASDFVAPLVNSSANIGRSLEHVVFFLKCMRPSAKIEIEIDIDRRSLTSRKSEAHHIHHILAESTGETSTLEQHSDILKDIFLPLEQQGPDTNLVLHCS